MAWRPDMKTAGWMKPLNHYCQTRRNSCLAGAMSHEWNFRRSGCPTTPIAKSLEAEALPGVAGIRAYHIASAGRPRTIVRLACFQ